MGRLRIRWRVRAFLPAGACPLVVVLQIASHRSFTWRRARCVQVSELGQRYPNGVATFENAWERFTPFLASQPSFARLVGEVAAVLMILR